jgi:hypothetical protein
MSTKEQHERSGLRQGTLDLLILRMQVLGSEHGHAITKAIEIQLRRCAGRAGLAIPGAALAHQAEMDFGRGRNLGEQSPGQVLPVDGEGGGGRWRLKPTSGASLRERFARICGLRNRRANNEAA